ncbi:MAG: sensor histidine kinase [Planctomycetaceae bacterium]
MEFLALQVLMLAAALLAVGVMQRRLKSVEKENAALQARPTPRDSTREGLAAVGVLVGDMCHHLVGHLTVILGQCELARMAKSGEKRLAAIESEARRLASTVERYRSGCRAWRDAHQRVAAGECARAAAAVVANFAEEREVRIHVCMEEPPLVDTNGMLLSQALVFMLRLAVEASPQGRGDVTLAVGQLPVEGAATHVAFGVADDGPGMEPTRLPSALHPFPREAPDEPSHALGYGTIQALARALGGELKVDTAPGAGTRATLKVPLCVAVHERPASRSTAGSTVRNVGA